MANNQPAPTSSPAWIMTAGAIICTVASVAGTIADRRELLWFTGAIVAVSFFVHVLTARDRRQAEGGKEAPKRYPQWARKAAVIGCIIFPLFAFAGFGWSMDWWDPFPAPPSKEKLILVSDFEKEAENALAIGGPIADEISDRVREFSNIEVRRMKDIVIDGPMAREAGTQAKASFVIWGRVNALDNDSVNLTSHFQILQEHDSEYLKALEEKSTKKQRILPVGKKVNMEMQQTLINEFNCTILMACGLVAYLEADHSVAVAILAEAIDACQTENAAENNHIAYYHLGNLHYKQGDFRTARENYQKAVELKPDDPQYRESLENASEAEKPDAEDADVPTEMLADEVIADDPEISEEADAEEMTAALTASISGEIVDDQQEDPKDTAPKDEYLGKKIGRSRLVDGSSRSLNLFFLSTVQKYGYVDRNLKIVIAPRFDEASPFQDGMARVLMGGAYGYINTKGDLVIPATYEEAHGFSEGLAGVVRKQRWGFIDKQGKVVIPFSYDDVWEFSDGLAKAQLGADMGFINKRNHPVIPFEHRKAESFSDGLAWVKTDLGYTFYDTKGKIAFKTRHRQVWSFSDGRAKAFNGRHYGFIDKQGKTVIPFKLRSVASFSGGKALVGSHQHGYYIDPDGNCVENCP